MATYYAKATASDTSPEACTPPKADVKRMKTSIFIDPLVMEEMDAAVDVWGTVVMDTTVP